MHIFLQTNIISYYLLSNFLIVKTIFSRIINILENKIYDINLGYLGLKKDFFRKPNVKGINLGNFSMLTLARALYIFMGRLGGLGQKVHKTHETKIIIS
jgi:hypothetical protein